MRATLQKFSFLDLESIEKHETYVGRSVLPSLFKSSQGIGYNPDMNGSLNISPKVADNSVFDGKLVKRLVVSPVRFQLDIG